MNKTTILIASAAILMVAGCPKQPNPPTPEQERRDAVQELLDSDVELDDLPEAGEGDDQEPMDDSDGGAFLEYIDVPLPPNDHKDAPYTGDVVGC